MCTFKKQHYISIHENLSTWTWLVKGIKINSSHTFFFLLQYKIILVGCETSYSNQTIYQSLSPPIPGGNHLSLNEVWAREPRLILVGWAQNKVVGETLNFYSVYDMTMYRV